MEEQNTTPGNDPVLLPFLNAKGERETEQLLGSLITEHAEPVITRVLRKKLRVSMRPAQGSQQNQDALEALPTLSV